MLNALWDFFFRFWPCKVCGFASNYKGRERRCINCGRPRGAAK